MLRRSKIRLFSFVAIGIIAAGGLIYTNWNDSQILKRQLEYTYMRSLQNLSSSVTSISNDLKKGIYVGTPQQLNNISSQLWRQSGTAKAALTSLPLGQTELDGTYKFLSQVGDYAMTLSRRALSGMDITDEEQKSLKSLSDYAAKLNQHISDLESQFSDGIIPVNQLLDQYIYQGRARNQSGGDEAVPTSMQDSMKEMESDLSSLPKLIYDGPFSDHMMEISPAMLKDAKEITRAQAQKKAAVVSGTTPDKLNYTQTEQSTMPSYCFSGDNIDVSVTVKGGLAAYLTNGRDVGDPKITTKQAIAKAEAYLKELGIKNMQTTYYEIANNVCTINFASLQGNVICYTDLIKVGVAMDNAEVVMMDARGYITNHKAERKLPTPKLTEQQGQASVSKLLKVESSRPAIIPTPGKNEVFCYEYKCKADNGQNVLVYVNAQTGAEEQILLLIINENGQLTV